MSLIVLDKASLSFGPQRVLEGVNLRIGEGEKIGLLGANGTGKSTLLRVLVGQQTLDGGKVQRSKGCRIGYLPQDILDAVEGTVLASVLASVPGRDGVQQELEQARLELDQAAARQDSEDEQMRLARRLAELQDLSDHFERYYDEHQAMRILLGLGFAESELTRPISELSGGWKMRVALAGMLFQQPDVLFLDEPTNHLDVPSVLWLDQFLADYRNSVVLICHDRQFFNRHIERVLSFEPEGLRSYRGDFEAYLIQRAAEEEVIEANNRKRERRIKELDRFVTKNKAQASRARQAQSKSKVIERLQRQVETPIVQMKKLQFSFPPTDRTGRDVMLLRGVSKSFGDLSLYREMSQGVYAGDRVALIGANGSGKSTLLKMMAGELAPDEGEFRLGANVKPGYFAQHHTEQLDLRRTVLEEVWQQQPSAGESRVRGVCGAFLFSGDDVDKAVGVLSGGERARVLLARLLINPGNLLLLDEPTTHLDMAAAEALAAALSTYDGTLVLVSHNTTLLNSLPTRLWDIQDGKMEEFPGTLREYTEHLAQRTAKAAAAKSRPARSKPAKTKPAKAKAVKPPRSSRARSEGKASKENKPEGPKETAQQRKDRKRAEARRRQELGNRTRKVRQRIEQAEARIAKLEAEQAELEPRLNDPELYADPARAREVTQRYEQIKRDLSAAYWKWEEDQEALERAKAESEQQGGGGAS